MRGLTQNQRLWLAGSTGVGLAGLLSWSYARFVEPYWLDVTHQRLSLASLELDPAWQGFRFAFLSDLHMERTGPPFHTLVQAVNQVLAEQVNIVFLGGDYFTKGVWNPAMGELMRRLTSANVTVIGVMGNHDYYGRRKDPERLITGFEEAGVRMLVNQAVALEYNGQRGWVAGVDDAYRGEPSLDEIASYMPAGTRPLVFLSHVPDYIKQLPPNYCHLQISGHTHGGQINFALPPLHRHFNWIRYTTSNHYSNYPLGWYHHQGNRLYVGRGLGFSGWQLRFNARPELPIFEFI